MPVADAPLRPKGGLASRPDAAAGWAGSGVTIAESSGLSLALVLARTKRVAQLRAAVADQLGMDLPRDLRVASGECMTLVSCGPGTYLAVSFPGPSCISVADIRRHVGEFATVVDYSGNFTVLIVGGPRAPDLLAKLCAVDLQARVLPAQLGIVTLIFQIRTYIWRLAPAGPFMMAVPRSMAVSFWDALLLTAQSLDDLGS